MGTSGCICSRSSTIHPGLSTEEKERIINISKINARKAKKVPRLDIAVNKLYRRRKNKEEV